jgi:cytochrome c-type biogenesis protein CcmF
MRALVGQVGVVVGLLSSGLLAVQAGRAQRRPGAVRRAELAMAVWGMVAGAVMAMAALQAALLANDFSIAYVVRNHARATPLLYTITGAWSALEGSIVLWTVVLAGYTVTVFRRLGDDDRLGAGALAIMGLVAVGFFGLMATVANPFRILDPVPPDGAGPNPLLQNHVLVAVHPPLLYLGFVGLTVPYAFAISALLRGQEGAEWLRRSRRWTLVAWSCLTGGIVLGGWWSYEVLGWGGFWAWDPVENASLLPWLVATAFLHSAVVQRHRGRLQATTLLLAISAFVLTLLGTFLTRSGVIASVHSFTQSGIGPVLLGFLLLLLVGSFALFGLRAHLVAGSAPLESLVSREGAVLANNLLLAVLAFAVLTGTLYPIFVEAFTGAQVSVGRPFFDRMAGPIGIALLLVMAVGPVMPYRSARPSVVWQRVRLPLLAAAAAGALLVATGVRRLGVVVAAMLAALVLATAIRQLVAAVPPRRRRRPRALAEALASNPGYWGGQLAHVGVALVAATIAVSGSLGTKTTQTLARGQPAAVGPYQVTYQGPVQRSEPSRLVTGARLELRRGGRVVRVMEPRLVQYPNQAQPIGTPAVWTSVGGDVYVTLVRLDDAGVEVTLYRYPLMYLLWLGGLLTAAGGIAALGGRRRVQRTLLPGAAGQSPAEDRREVPTGA